MEVHMAVPAERCRYMSIILDLQGHNMIEYLRYLIIINERSEKMELREFYEQIGGDYEAVIRRLRKEERIRDYLKKFAAYHYDVLIRTALDACDYQTAFREVHNLKGLCANLNLDTLQRTASALTEALRGRDPKEDLTPLVNAMQADYDAAMGALQELTEE